MVNDDPCLSRPVFTYTSLFVYRCFSNKQEPQKKKNSFTIPDNQFIYPNGLSLTAAINVWEKKDECSNTSLGYSPLVYSLHSGVS